MAAFEFRPSNLTITAAGAIFVPVQGVASAEFSFENTYADMSREFVTWTGIGDEPLRWSLGPEHDDLLSLPLVEIGQDGIFGFLNQQELDDSDDDEEVDEDEDAKAPFAASVPFVNPAALTSTITAPVPAPKAPTNRKRGSDNSLLKQTLVDSARKVSYPTTFQAPAASKPHPAGPFMGHPIPDSLKPMLTHRLKKPVAPLGSPFCPKEVPAWVTNRRQDDPETEEGANKRSKASGEWERRVARTQAASRRLQDVVAMAEAVELPSAVYAQRRNKRVGRKLRGIDLDLPRLR